MKPFYDSTGPRVRPLLMLLFVLSGLYCKAQMSQIPLIDIATNPQSAAIYNILLLDDDVTDKGLSQHKVTALQQILVEEDLTYIVVNVHNRRFIVFKPGLFRSQRESMQVIHHNQERNFFLLCPKQVEDICGCGTSLYYYVPESQQMKSVQKPFSLSMKRNLTKLLRQKFDITFDAQNFDSTCALLGLLEASY